MATRKADPAVLAHLEWLGYVKPTGLVVSAPALIRAGAILDRRDAEGQRLLRACLNGTGGPTDELREARARYGGESDRDTVPILPSFRPFAESVLGWSFSSRGYAGTDEHPIPPDLEVTLPELGETLRPDFAVRELDPKDDAPHWQLLVRTLETGEDFDRPVRRDGHLEASPRGRMERLLRQTGVPAGLLFNGHALRLISAPKGESSGWLDFRVAEMVQTAGRPISTALRLLLSEQRLLALPRKERLPALLEESRRYQNDVSERLAEQVLHALYELLRGFQAAHDASEGELLREPLADDPDEVYHALLTVILRLVFLFYAEEREMLPGDNETFQQSYSLSDLHQRLRDDAALNPDTMDQRYGAWAQLLVLFRMIHDGARADGVHLPARRGVLFDPDRFRFLEGRAGGGARQTNERLEPPKVPDGTVYRALEKLLVLDGERISYRALDVEQIGSVYETMMGFRLETATGASLAIKSQKKQGAPTGIDLEALLREAPAKRSKWLQDRADRKLTAKVSQAVRNATTVEDLHAALEPVVDRAATPDLVHQGALVLQPSEARRRSGSHYTPRALTEPIVRHTLEPILARLRGKENEPPLPEQILDLKVCDPAIGSGAFLVEACRQLGDALVDSWRFHKRLPAIPPDENEEIFARRLIAQRCLYGVDRNPVAVDLAKMSLWLVTLAKDHALTFIDHALRHGDSLVGLSRRQLEAFHWDSSKPPLLKGLGIRDALDCVRDLRSRIREADETVGDFERRDLWDEAQFELAKVRLYGDLVVAAFFEGKKSKEREAQRDAYESAVLAGDAEVYRSWLEEMRTEDLPLAPFHWEIEFPEVFERPNAGFDSIVGNPPFLSSRAIWSVLGAAGRDFLKLSHPNSGGKAVDLVAHFLRQSFLLLRTGGTFGLIATNTVAQGDTRIAGLGWISKNGGYIYRANKRHPWPGSAAVIVSTIHVLRDTRPPETYTLNDRQVNGINSFLVPATTEAEPVTLRSNKGLSYLGHMIHGIGFTFDDRDSTDVVSSLSTMKEIVEHHPDSADLIFPYIGGEEINTDPLQRSHRFVINFSARSLEEARLWPELLDIVERKVLPGRLAIGGYSVADRRREYWWQFGTYAASLQDSLADLRGSRCLVRSRVSTWHALAMQPTSRIFAETLVVFPIDTHSAFCALQSRPHEIWARFFGSSMKDDLRYTPSDCFETFPFPPDWEEQPVLEEVGKRYYDFRAGLMVENDEGLTKTYNRFHDPEEDRPQILELRRLHAAMDRAVLDAYGWTDVPTDCEFLLDYEIDEEEWSPRRKKPYRYRWPDEVHDEVLARLLELNAERAREERRSGAAAGNGRQGSRTKRRAASIGSGRLF